MKQFIILCATIALGIFLYNLIAGSDEGSILNSVEEVWRSGISTRTYTP